MPKFEMAIQHKLTQEEALRRTKTILDGVKTQFADKISNLQEKWTENGGTFSFSTKGVSISGTLIVKPAVVEIFGNLPFRALPFKGKIKATIRERAEKALA